MSTPGAQLPLGRLPPLIVLNDLGPELADYLQGWFSLHWPQARIRRHCSPPVLADLQLVDRLPPQPHCPTLWLAEIDHSTGLQRLTPRLWRLAMPTTPGRLRSAIQQCLIATAMV